ncbi:MAG: hypothetical protein IJJ34_05110 [Clostridia bacterium]|nr:hypothetical protein [Clostridia bacterium]
MPVLIREMIDWIRIYYGSGMQLFAMVLAYLYLFVYAKELKPKLLYPCFVILLLLTNPILYRFLFVKTRYWRYFWLLPQASMLAAASTRMIQNLPKKAEKALVLLGISAVLLSVGHFAYFQTQPWEMHFTVAENPYKIEQETIDICDTILERDDDPLCIFDFRNYNYARQYSADIHQFFGRSAVAGYIMPSSDLEREMCRQMDSATPDYTFILTVALENNCEFIITKKEKAIPAELLETYAFTCISETEGHLIYQAPAIQ